MLTAAVLADACNPSSPGCRPETEGSAAFPLLLLLGIAIIVVGAVVLGVVLLVRRRRNRA